MCPVPYYSSTTPKEEGAEKTTTKKKTKKSSKNVRVVRLSNGAVCAICFVVHVVVNIV